MIQFAVLQSLRLYPIIFLKDSPFHPFNDCLATYHHWYFLELEFSDILNVLRKYFLSHIIFRLQKILTWIRPLHSCFLSRPSMLNCIFGFIRKNTYLVLQNFPISKMIQIMICFFCTDFLPKFLAGFASFCLCWSGFFGSVYGFYIVSFWTR